MNKLSSGMLEQGETQLKRTESMINSMTKEERGNPQLLAQSPSRRRRVARGSGHEEKEVSRLISDFTRMRSMMKQMSQGGGLPGMGGMPGMPGMGGLGNMFGGMGGNMPRPGFRNSQPQKKKKKAKKKRGFADL
jgi:signal recognition particle subunit SRP54